MFHLLAVDSSQLRGRLPKLVPSLLGTDRLLQMFGRYVHTAASVLRISEGQVCVGAMSTAGIRMAGAGGLSTGARALRHSGLDHDLGILHEASNQILFSG